MVDSRFFERKQNILSLEDLCRLVSGEIGRGDPGQSITDIAPLAHAQRSALSFFHVPRHNVQASHRQLDHLKTTQAGVCLVPAAYRDVAAKDVSVIVCEDPYQGFAHVAHAFFKEKTFHQDKNIHPSACIDSSAQIAPGVIIGENVSIRKGVSIGAGSVIGPGVSIGDACVIGAHVSIFCARLSAHVHIKAGARIGQRGFGFAVDRQGRPVDVPQLGRVYIGERTEIGANTAIDRGTLDDTIIENDVRIDNLVQIGHNVHIEAGCILAGQVGIAGSTTIGKQSVLGGQVGVSGHLDLAPETHVAAKSGVMKSTHASQRLNGIPAEPAQTYWRRRAQISRWFEKREHE